MYPGEDVLESEFIEDLVDAFNNVPSWKIKLVCWVCPQLREVARKLQDLCRRM